MTYNPQGLVAKRVKKKNNPKRLGKFYMNVEHLGEHARLLHHSEYEQKFTGYPTEIIEFASDRETIHPTQKPVALMEYLVRTYTNAGEIVLDNCMGSGTTGIACANSDREFIGIEVEETYFNLASERICLHTRQSDLSNG